jgi:Co/Zn/Cd efflux system component
LAGKYAGLAWLDPMMGLVAAALIAAWSWERLGRAGKILLGREIDAKSITARAPRTPRRRARPLNPGF